MFSCLIHRHYQCGCCCCCCSCLSICITRVQYISLVGLALIGSECTVCPYTQVTKTGLAVSLVSGYMQDTVHNGVRQSWLHLTVDVLTRLHKYDPVCFLCVGLGTQRFGVFPRPRWPFHVPHCHTLKPNAGSVF